MSSTRQPGPGAGGKIRVLLVDDHKSFLWGLAKLVNSDPGMEVVGKAKDRAEAFRLAAESRPDVIVLDVELGDGVKSLDFLPDLIKQSPGRVLILTGARSSEVHDQAIERGARGVILKEEAPEEILRAIEKVHAGDFWWVDAEAAGRLVQRSRGAAGAPRESDPLDELTEAEMNVFLEAVKNPGSTNQEIASQMNISVKTFNNHLGKVHSKLGKNTRLELFIYAVKRGIVQI